MCNNHIETSKEVFSLLTDTVFNSNGEVLNGNCSVGQLTTIGFKQQEENGLQLKKSYVDSGFLATTITPSEIYIRSDSELCALYTLTHFNYLFPYLQMNLVRCR